MTLPNARVVVAVLTLGALLAACGGGGGGSTPPVTSPTPTQSPGFNESAFQCPTSDTTLSYARGATASATTRHIGVRKGAPAVSDRLLVVSYNTGASNSKALDARVASLGAKTINDVAFTYIGRSMRVVRVTPSTLASVQNSLRALPGVRDVSPSRRLSALTVNGPYFRGIPYFMGEPGSVAPLYQTPTTGGQWDMNIMGLGDAFAYSQPANGSTVAQNPNALGSTSVKLAIVDTGEDVTHPDLSGATISRTRCFITDPNDNSSAGTHVTDGFGHGTDVTGIAAASSSTPNYGFTGTSGNVSLMLYRVFPTPDDNCQSPDSSVAENDPQCGAADVDIASAIKDAVSNGANVINLSLGLSLTPCVNGQDPDKAEGEAIGDAIAANVIVVSSAGNDGTATQPQPPDAPACDPGVIAAGASAYNDSQPNGTNYTGSNTEYVANYSNVGSTNVLHSASSWGIVAPGGDPAANDNDALHWIENIWTTTPFDSTYAGTCADPGPFNEPGNCRVDIAGTSMSSPHVAGLAALILSVNPSYQSPSAMRTLLCSTADDIGAATQGCGRVNAYRAMATALNDQRLP